ncbi:MAG: hypothetical protein I8H94_03760 [Rhodobacteraceae bacterium]|nr:hypothetical protein [Paracoccaceae bacterium]
MTRQRELGTLWIGGPLSWLEQLCLKSFVDQGHRITLFHYDDIPNVPDGVALQDGRTILKEDIFLQHKGESGLALFVDLFRIHMLKARPGMIWVDADVYCLRPMPYDGDVVMGFEAADGQQVTTAVLGVPQDHPMLDAMLALMADLMAIPPFLTPNQRSEYEAARDAGTPIHVRQQTKGTWGPLMLTHFAAAHGMMPLVQPADVFSPIRFSDRKAILKPPRKVETHITPATATLRLWASNKREIALRHMGLPPKSSYLADLLAQHGIRAADAPIGAADMPERDAGLIDALAVTQVERFADLAGHAQSLALAMHKRFGALIDLVDVDHKGRFAAEQSPWVASYRDYLQSNGVAPDAIRVVRAESQMRPADVVANLSGFGDVYKAAPLGQLLDATLAPSGVLITDIRKGSGTWPLLKPRGRIDELSTRDDGGEVITRVLLRAAEGNAQNKNPDEAPAAEPVSAGGSADDWSAIAKTLIGKDGFYTANDSHSFLYIPRNPDTLVVTFDNLDIAMTKRDDRRPWGFGFIEKQGWSMLGVMAGGWTWYRDAWVSAEFDRLRDEGFFAKFKRVVFYGASMGGYAACAFSAACPGADVVAISPQSTLDRALVPWETRYKTAWDRDFSGPYGDAAEASRTARRVTVLYDPYEPLDSGHVERLTGANVVKLRTPLLGHRLGSSLSQMGILTPIILGALNGTLAEAEFYKILRARKDFQRYQSELFKRAVERGHPALARHLGRWVLKRGDNRYIRKALKTL